MMDGSNTGSPHGLFSSRAHCHTITFYSPQTSGGPHVETHCSNSSSIRPYICWCVNCCRQLSHETSGWDVCCVTHILHPPASFPITSYGLGLCVFVAVALVCVGIHMACHTLDVAAVLFTHCNMFFSMSWFWFMIVTSLMAEAPVRCV